MKKTTYLLFILYFLVLVTSGVIFYLRCIRGYTITKTPPIQVEIISTRDFIYYVNGNILYRVDPTDPTKTNNFETQGEIGKLDLNKSKAEIAYETKNSSGDWEIWQGDANNIQKEKLAAKDISTFSDWEDFLNPKYNPDKTKLAILAEGNSSDAIFVKNLDADTWQNITEQTKVKIADYSWNQDSKNLIYCSSTPPNGTTKNACWTFNFENSSSTKTFDIEAKRISWDKTDNPFYLSKSQTPHIYTINPESKVSTQVDDVIAPKVITNFQIDYQGKKIVYEVVFSEKSDIYLSNIDGSNRLQLTTDGTSQQPLFSPLEDKIAFLRQKNGIYTITIDKMSEQKIVNLEDTIDALSLWR
ncbi:MAG: hypothetical protein WCV58_04295 [Patescibacteria group bacterium]